jgi:leucyl-tRNA synthetase
MPGWAGSSWYFLRYMDAKNETEFASKEATDYWNSVDFYLGGTEHAVGHLLYSRFWTKFLCDRDYISFDEPFKKLVNQGMIQGRSSLLYRVKNENKYVSADLKDQYETTELYVDINLVKNDVLDIEGLKKWRSQYADAEFVSSENGSFYCGYRVEKMSKSKFNTQNPNEIIEKYSADTLRLYEMFLGPLEHSKPWDTSGIDGVHKFLRKFWRLFMNKEGDFAPSDAKATPQELKALHKTIKKIAEDIENQSFNTSIPAFMICVNELASLKCNKVEILKPFLILLSPFAPHISEELWHQLGETKSIVLATYPEFKEEYLKEDAHQYPISINGKVRAKMSFALDLSKEEVEKAVLENPDVQKWVEGKQLRKFIFVPKRIVNLVV